MGSARSIRLISLGCPKNLIDAEVLLGKLTQAGYRIVQDNQSADIMLINTCCFIKEAQQESQEIIEQAIRLKRQNKYKKIIVAGCFPQHNPDFLYQTYGTQIDALVSLFQRDRIVEICERLFDKTMESSDHVAGTIDAVNGLHKDRCLPTVCRTEPIRLRLTPLHYSYVRIAEGCSNACTYCILPRLHGRYRSKPLETVVQEVKALVKSGAREINLVAQDTTSYGQDLYGQPCLSKLLEHLSRINGLRWLRLLYTHPTRFTPDLIELISRNDKIVKYVDLPIQHISNPILRKMGRRTSAHQIRELINQLRTKIKGLFLRTTIIVGFPGEKESDFQQLLDFLREIEFERLGAFQYSVEAGTPAARFKPQIPGKVKEARFDAIMSLQQQIAFKKNKELMDRQINVIIDNKIGKHFVGRTYGDAPEVDGNIYLKETGLTIGQIYNARVTGTRNYDLIGKIEHPIRFTADPPAKAKRRAGR